MPALTWAADATQFGSAVTRASTTPWGGNRSGGKTGGKAEQLVKHAGIKLGHPVNVPRDAQQQRPANHKQQRERPALVDGCPAGMKADFGGNGRRGERCRPQARRTAPAARSKKVRPNPRTSPTAPTRAISATSVMSKAFMPLSIGTITGKL